jgi:hypothetical protein
MARKGTGGRRLPISGPKRTETANPGQVNAPFQAPGEAAPARPKQQQITKTDLGLSEFSRNLAAGKAVGDYETRGSMFDFGGTTGEIKSPSAISDNTAHIDALHAMANEASDRLIGIGAEHSLAESSSKGKVRANSSTYTAMGPAKLSLEKSKASFVNAHLAHLAGDAISSTIHVKEGAQHLVNAVNHLESGDAWGAVNEKGNAKSSFRSWRADPTDGFTPTISLAGAFHSKVAAAVNGYTQHVMKATASKPELSEQLDHAELKPVSYTPADSDTKSPLIKQAAPAAPAKELSPEEQERAVARAAGLKSMNNRSAQAAGTVKKEKLPNYNNFGQIYNNAKSFAAKQIGKPDKTGKIYTQEMHDEEFAPVPKEEQPKISPATPKTRPARNRGYKGSEEPMVLEGQEDTSEAPATTKSVFDSQIAAHMGGGAGYDKEAEEETRKKVEGMGGLYLSNREEEDAPEEDSTPVELPDEDTSKETSKKAAKRAPRVRPVVSSTPAVPVKEARYDVFNAASQAGK